MRKLATGSSIERGWLIIRFLNEKVSKWPKTSFCLSLPNKETCEVWLVTEVLPKEFEQLKAWIKEWKENQGSMNL